MIMQSQWIDHFCMRQENFYKLCDELQTCLQKETTVYIQYITCALQLRLKDRLQYTILFVR